MSTGQHKPARSDGHSYLWGQAFLTEPIGQWLCVSGRSFGWSIARSDVGVLSRVQRRRAPVARTTGNAAQRTPGRLLYMVCYKTDPSSLQTYWNVYEADTAEEATALDVQAHIERTRGQVFPTNQPHRCWTVPYNRAGMTPEQTYAAYVAAKATGSAA